MKRIGLLRVIASFILTALPAWAVTPLGSAFTYQGKLNTNGASVNAIVDMKFSLWDSPTNGGQVGSALVFDGIGANGPPVIVSDGVFAATLDFGSAAFTSGNARWLQIEVRNPHDAGNAGPYVTLTRQPILSTPFATYSSNTRGINVDSAGKVGIGTTTPGEKLEVNSGNIYINGDNKGLIVDWLNKRIGFMKYLNHEGGIWRGSAQDFEIGRVNTADVTTGVPNFLDMYIDGSGNVGIGTAAGTLPQKLTVNGAVRSTTGGFVFPDGTTQTTSLLPNGATTLSIPTDLSVGGHINGAAGMYFASCNKIHTANTNMSSTTNVDLPDSSVSVQLPPGIAVINWSASAWTQSVSRIEFQPTIVGVGSGPAVPFVFNVVAEHMSVSGSWVVNITEPATTSVKMFWRSPAGNNMTIDENDYVSWTLVLYRY